MRKCPQCGSELKDAAVTCFSCGYRIKSVSAEKKQIPMDENQQISLEKKYLVDELTEDENVSEDVQQTDEIQNLSSGENSVDEERKKQKKKIIKMTGVAAAFIVLLLLAIYLSKKGSNPLNYTTQPDSTSSQSTSATGASEMLSSFGMQTGFVIWNNGVDVYERADENSSVLAHFAMWTRLNILQVQTGWVQIQLDSFTGWCPADHVQLGEPVSTTAMAPQYVAVVNSEVGLNLRVSPDTSSKRYLVIPNHSQVNVYTVANGWANVEYNGITGWCSNEYLQTQEEASSSMAAASTAVSDTDISADLSAANQVIESYRGKTTKYGKVVMDDASAITFLKDAENVYRAGLCMTQMFTSIDQNDMISVGLNYYRYYHVTDANFRSVADVCEFVFSFFTDEICVELLRDRLLEKDGKLYALYSENSGSATAVQTDFAITSKTDTQINVTAVVQTADGRSKSKSYPCVVEDGNWVFNFMELFNDNL